MIRLSELKLPLDAAFDVPDNIGTPRFFRTPYYPSSAVPWV